MARRPTPSPQLLAARATTGLAFGTFVVLGMPKSAFGVAWPTIADDLSRSVAELGLVIAIFTAGYMVASAVSGATTERFGTGAALVGSSSVSVLGIVGYAAAPSWLVLLAAALVLGSAGGMIDAALNAHVAVSHGPRVMNLLHASFGVGATLGPLLMTVILAFGGSWRLGYWVLAAAQLGLTVLLWRTRRLWESSGAVPDEGPVAPAGRQGTLLLWAGLAVFFVYAGIEVGVGAWAASLFTESRGLSDAAAGAAVTAYWGSFTVGRFVAGAIGDRFRPRNVVPLASVAAAGSLALLWWSPATWVGPVALGAAGLSLAPIFPAMVLLTPVRLGSGLARRAVGYQLAAASLGIMAIPGVAGLLVAWFDLESVPPFLFAMALVLLVMNSFVDRVAESST